jgi:hypothetical protein
MMQGAQVRPMSAWPRIPIRLSIDLTSAARLAALLLRFSVPRVASVVQDLEVNR